ncbi:hypothetical protein BV898_18909 [Hypsibius exemplaris]|uniref:Uncharacterized protein n=1 Tax=Hypsibius exemplaris TaxID=2072580 RepID=A0A9X6NJP3_HYPEX|nr:hypothetical protein BV898_18909 [Hypsibius exemplaris]
MPMTSSLDHCKANQVQHLGSAVAAVLLTASGNADVTNSDKWLSVIVQITKNITTIQTVVTNHDTGPACAAVKESLANDLVNILSSLQ